MFKTRYISYTGPSMKPTLKEGDGLYIMPCDQKVPVAGDLVVYKSPENGRRVVHRIVDIDTGGIRTRGDNNNTMDPYTLQWNDIEGWVVHIKREGRQLAPRELPAARKRPFVAKLAAGGVFLLRPLYRFLALINPVKFKVRRVVYQKKSGTEQMLFWRRQPIAHRPAGEAQWRVRLPFRLFIRHKDLN